MVEGQPAGVDGLVGYLVAQLTTSGALTWLLTLEMTQRTGRGCHRDVTALDDLRVTRGAAQSLAAPQLGQVRRVIEQDIAEKLLPHQ